VPAGSRWSYLDGEARVHIGNITYSRAVVCQTKAYIKGQNERPDSRPFFGIKTVFVNISWSPA